MNWYRKAAEQGNASGQASLGVSYANGTGVVQDDKEAVNWCRKAAEQGNANAQYNLAINYAKGTGIPQDYVSAYAWCSLAAAQDGGDATTLRDLIQKEMTRDQVAEAQRMAASLDAAIRSLKSQRTDGTALPSTRPK